MRNYINIIENINTNIEKLYHGTCLESANNIIDNGWYPKSSSTGGNMGQNKYLYLTTHKDNALWFANEIGCDTLVEISNIPINYLLVDPEDGMYENVHDEIYESAKLGLPGYVVL